MTKQRFVLLDRDGTIIVERHYLSDPEQVELLPGVVSGLKKLHRLGLGLLVVSNQSAVGRGLIDQARLDEIHARMNKLLEDEGVVLDGIYICPHHPDNHCNCRKPNTGLPELAAKDFNFNLNESFVIGDKECDIELGHNMGAETFLVLTGYGRRTAMNDSIKAGYVVNNLDEAAHLIATLIGMNNKMQVTGQ